MEENFDKEQLQMVSMEIILAAGDARSHIHGAFADMRSGAFKEASQKLDDAHESIKQAHAAQTSLLQKLANGVPFEVDILLVHAQDHLMTTMTLHEMSKEMLFMHKKMRTFSV